MKSLTAVCQTGASAMPAINSNGRVSRPSHPNRGDGENAEMKMYLSKLKDLVPFMPKNRKLSKLEIIQHVIDYICDLQSELETHPEIDRFDAAAALNLNGVAQHLASTQNIDEIQNGPSHQQYQPQQQQPITSDQEGHEDHHNNDRISMMDSSSRLSGTEIGGDNNIIQQQSSPAVRQPLATRQTPNTILPSTHQLPHHLYSATAAHYTSSSNHHLSAQLHPTQQQQQPQQQNSNATADQKLNIESSRQHC